MSKFFPEKNEKDLKNWNLPEFGLISHLHNATNKLLKNPTSKKNILAGQVQLDPEYHSASKKGYEAGLQQSMIEVQRKIQVVDDLIQQFEQYKNQYFETIRRQNMDAITLICEKVFLEAIHVDKEIFAKYISSALELIEKQSLIFKIHCHPALYELLHGHKNILESKNIALESSAQLAEFGFRIETDSQCIDFQLRSSISKFLDDHQYIYDRHE